MYGIMTKISSVSSQNGKGKVIVIRDDGSYDLLQASNLLYKFSAT